MNREPLYSMTEMTGEQASSTRTIVVGYIEFPWRLFVVLMIAFGTGLVPASLAWLLFGGGWSLLVLATWMTGFAWLFHGQTNNGLQLRNYVALLNKHQSVKNHFMLGTSLVSVPTRDWLMILPGSRPNPLARLTVSEQTRRVGEQQPGQIVEAVFGDPVSTKPKVWKSKLSVPRSTRGMQRVPR